jgi:hypothetical protein
VQIQEENQHLKENVHMFDQRIAKLEKDLETYANVVFAKGSFC